MAGASPTEMKIIMLLIFPWMKEPGFMLPGTGLLLMLRRTLTGVEPVHPMQMTEIIYPYTIQTETFASYVHLRKNGSIVEVGDIVERGDFIGYSGNTGLSTGPHLHFSVNVPTIEGSRMSIPVKTVGR